MGVLDNIKSWGKKRAAQSRSAFLINSDAAFEILAPSGYTPLSKNEVILRCVHKIADMVSNMTIMLMENGENGDVRIRNELSKKVDIYPNRDMNRKNFIYKIVSDMILYGNSVAVPVYKVDLLDNIVLLSGEKVKIDNTGRKEGYFISCDETILEQDEVLHFSLVPDSNKPFRGVGFTPQILDTVRNLLQANATKTGFLKSKWKPSLIISINADTEELKDPEKRRKILGSYINDTERGEPWLIPAGEIDIKTIQPLNLKDLAIQESITLDIQSITAAFGIPAFLLGIGDFDRNAYNNFVATTIMSFAQIIQQELSNKLLYSPTWYFRFSEKSLMQYSLAEKSAFVIGMISGGMLNRNEGRAEFNYSPVDVEGMNDYAILENYLKVGDIDKQKKLIQDGNGS